MKTRETVRSIFRKTVNFLLVLFFGAIALFAIYGTIKGGVYDHFKNKDSLFYFNKKGVIVQMGDEKGHTHDKFHRPTIFHSLLIRDLKDTTLFIEWSTSKEKYYNYQIGDTVKFDYIKKEHWFYIKRVSY